MPSAVASTLASLLSLGLAAQRLEPIVPESLEERLQLLEPLWPRPVEPPRAVPSLAHKSRLLENTEMLRDGRPGDLEPRSDLPRGELAVAHEQEDLPPAWFRDRLDCCVHALI